MINVNANQQSHDGASTLGRINIHMMESVEFNSSDQNRLSRCHSRCVSEYIGDQLLLTKHEWLGQIT